MWLGVKVSAIALALMVAACAPGGSTTSNSAPSTSSTTQVSKDVSGAGEVTLTVWDQNTDGGINTAQAKLNAAFLKK